MLVQRRQFCRCCWTKSLKLILVLNLVTLRYSLKDFLPKTKDLRLETQRKSELRIIALLGKIHSSWKRRNLRMLQRMTMSSISSALSTLMDSFMNWMDFSQVLSVLENVLKKTGSKKLGCKFRWGSKSTLQLKSDSTCLQSLEIKWKSLSKTKSNLTKVKRGFKKNSIKRNLLMLNSQMFKI